MKKFRFFRFIPGMLAFTLISCAGTKAVSGADDALMARPVKKVSVTTARTYALLPPSSMQGFVCGRYRMELTSRSGTQKSELLITADGNVLSAEPAVRYESAAGTVVLDTHAWEAAFGGVIKPEQFLADLQFCWYNPSDVAVRLQKSNLRFTMQVQQNGAVEARRIYNGLGRRAGCAMQITRTASRIVVENFYNKYTYTLIPLEEVR